MFLKSEVQIGTLQIDVSVHGETKTGTLKRSRVRHIGGPKFDRCYPKTRPDAYQLGSLLRIFTWGVFQLPFFNQFMGFLTYQLLGFVPCTRHAMGWLPWLAISSALGFESLQFPEVRQSCWGIINSYHPIIAVNLLKHVSIWEEAALAHGKTALVTGAAGFIGSHVARLSREEELVAWFWMSYSWKMNT